LEAVKESLSSLRRLGDTSSTRLRNGDIPLVAIESHPRIVAARGGGRSETSDPFVSAGPGVFGATLA